MIHFQEFQMLIKVKNIVGGFAALSGVFAFSCVYYFAKQGIDLNNLYWFALCFNFTIFSGLLFFDNKNKWVGSLYLMSFCFFGICFLASLADFIFLDKLRMSKVYWALIGSALLTSITYIYKWVKYNLF